MKEIMDTVRRAVQAWRTWKDRSEEMKLYLISRSISVWEGKTI